MVQKYLKKNWQHHWSDLTPTSSGLQPFEVIVITNQEVKEKIRPISWNQSVVTDCSHLLYLAWDTYTADRINKMFDLTNTIRDMKTKAGKITVKCF
jgi:nitroreductase